MNDSLDAAQNLSPVLVTGGSGYLGGHTVLALLRAGHRVRTTIRSADRRAEVLALIEAQGIDAGDRLEFVVAELTADAGWAEAVDGVQHVLHVASPFPAADPENPDDVIVPARDGALRVLAAAHDARVRRVVFTSSFAAVGYSAPKSLEKEREFTEDDWTDPDDENIAYIRSKVIAERAAWRFIENTDGAMELTAVNPSGIFGPVLGGRLSGSVGLVRSMLEGLLPAVPPVAFGVVDVRDVADLQLRAMAHPGAAGQRFLAVSDTVMSLFEVGQVLAGRFPQAPVPQVELSDDQVRTLARTEPALRDAVRQLGRRPVISNAKARRVLGWSPRPAAQTVLDTGESLFSHGLLGPIETSAAGSSR